MTEQSPNIHRKIIHIDMDAFYASVEQRDFPEYRGKPLVVGGLPEGRGGVVATASYEARKFGIRSAMSSKKALQLCPHVMFVRPRFNVYREVSQHIREIFSRYTDLIEPLSLDEAYLDVTNDKQDIGSAIEIAKLIKQAIKDELQLTASAGVSINKFVAKIASDINKPDGLKFIGPSSIENFMEQLPVEKFFGVGKVTAQKMKQMGLHTGADLKKLEESELTRHFGKVGRFYYQIVRGIDNREVQPHRETKSLGAEDTFAYDLTTLEEMEAELDKIAVTVHNRLLKYELKGRTITLKVKYHDFKQITRNQSFTTPVNDLETISNTAKQLMAATGVDDVKVRLLGISLSNFGELQVKQRDDKELGPGDQLELEL
ncbi:DNA polymerase IV [Mucilaginibacter sp. cycad4]|uniref:DNA polymerase IV n=1 Tax=Mucilaginibacter sp. cycad4 TaxID=3342096 RepID=UPI002AABE68C|nr:DNA polymerase IV [Mucilaginibacter gossypii]WPU99411.1 DNA polymerase IV [Mucilaginibacter gossypii]